MSTDSDPSAPGIFARLGLIRRKKLESAAEVYNRFVRSLAADRTPSDRDAAELVRVMGELGFDDKKLEGDIDKMQEVSGLPAMIAEIEADEAALATLTATLSADKPVVQAEVNRLDALAHEIARRRRDLQSKRDKESRLALIRDTNPDLFPRV